MFKNYRIEAKLVKNSKAETPVEEETKPLITPEDVERVAHNIIKKVVIGTTIIIGAATVLSTVSQIAVNACDNHNKDED